MHDTGAACMSMAGNVTSKVYGDIAGLPQADVEQQLAMVQQKLSQFVQLAGAL